MKLSLLKPKSQKVNIEEKVNTVDNNHTDTTADTTASISSQVTIPISEDDFARSTGPSVKNRIKAEDLYPRPGVDWIAYCTDWDKENGDTVVSVKKGDVWVTSYYANRYDGTYAYLRTEVTAEAQEKIQLNSNGAINGTKSEAA